MEAVKVIIKRMENWPITLKNKELGSLLFMQVDNFSPFNSLCLIKKALPKMGGLI